MRILYVNFLMQNVGFILCEEDKTTQQSIDYWFKVVDLDDNGIITYNNGYDKLEDPKWNTFMKNKDNVWTI